MAVDLEAIRRRMQELSGVKKTSSVQLWKPDLGEYRVRCLSFPNSSEGQPFAERWFYYFGENSVLAPKQFGKPDPIAELISKLYSTGKPEDRTLAKQLSPKMRVYAPVIVRGQEEKGPMLWSFGKIVYQRLLSFFLDEDYGNILDEHEGYDLKVTISQQPGKQFKDTVVDCKGKPTRLHSDPDVVSKWKSQIPNVDDMYRLKTYEEIENLLNRWLNGDLTPDTNSIGTEKNAPVSTSSASSNDSTMSSTFSSLDDAFAELMGDE